MSQISEAGTCGQSAKTRPVVLVHGIFDTSKIFAPMANRLKVRGFRPLAPDLKPSSGATGLDALAAQIGPFVDRYLPPEEQFDLVGFSMGGLVSRYYVQRLGGMKRVAHLITISAPHHGSYSAYLTMGNVGAKQMRPGSVFLQDLNRDAAMLDRVRFVSIWTPLDLMIVPANSSRLGVGEEYRIPVALHPWMLRNMRTLELVAKLLRG
ncbi:MAG TPA: triacylglycerol lipase [Terriglobales bacterium]|jgi:triacylglycerol lipase|nr:triacylglycerol lipase [Terriglobales bacterium]